MVKCCCGFLGRFFETENVSSLTQFLCKHYHVFVCVSEFMLCEHLHVSAVCRCMVVYIFPTCYYARIFLMVCFQPRWPSKSKRETKGLFEQTVFILDNNRFFGRGGPLQSRRNMLFSEFTLKYAIKKKVAFWSASNHRPAVKTSQTDVRTSSSR